MQSDEIGLYMNKYSVVAYKLSGHQIAKSVQCFSDEFFDFDLFDCTTEENKYTYQRYTSRSLSASMHSYSENGKTRYRRYSEGCPGEQGFVRLYDSPACHKIGRGHYVFQNREVAKCPDRMYSFYQLCTAEEIPNSAQMCSKTQYYKDHVCYDTPLSGTYVSGRDLVNVTT